MGAGLSGGCELGPVRTGKGSSLTDAAYEFDVALSFAGDDRDFVRDVAEGLKREGLRIFFDEDYAAETWGEDLVEYFDQVYRVKSRFAIIFISRHYADKMWPRHERRSALARALEQRSAYVLPVRLDDTQLEGLRPTVGYVDARRVGLAALLRLAVQKISGTNTALAPGVIDRVPRSEVEAQELLAVRPPAWEYLYMGARLLAEREAVEDRFRDFSLGFALPGRFVAETDVIDYAMAELSTLEGLVSTLESLMSHEAQDAAFGLPGEPGDPDLISHLARRWNDVYVEFLNWAARVRGASVPSAYRGLMGKLGRFADSVIVDYRALIDDIVSQFDAVPARLAGGEAITLTMIFDIKLPEGAMEDFQAEVDRLRRSPI